MAPHWKAGKLYHDHVLTIPKHPANVLVTKMVANSRPRVGIERDGSARAADFHNTNQHLSGQNETGRNGHQQISSAVLSIAQRTIRGCKEIYLV